MLMQMFGAIAGIVIVALALGPDGPWPVYAVAAFVGAYVTAWAWGRWKYGRGTTVTPSMPEPPKHP
jgi:membrane protein implicated in regulation of membrane protease activity